MRKTGGFWAVLGGLALLAPAGAGGGEFYAWRTEDGVFSYADNREAIPPRYADSAKTIRPAGIQSYARFTRQDPEAAIRYAERLSRRLENLRELNAPPSPTPLAAAGTAPVAGSGPVLSVAAGSGENAPRIEFATDGAGGAPLVVEPVLSKRSADVRTRRTTLVKQGGRTVAVLLGPSHERSPSDIYDEDALER